MEIEKLLEDLAFSKTEIATLTDDEKKDQHEDVISQWSARYNDVIIKKPEVIEHFKKQFDTTDFNKSKEAIRKQRKRINTDLSLGLTAKQLDELTDEEFSTNVKEHSAKDVTQKVTDLEDQLKEEKRLREESETRETEEVEKVKSEYSKKDIQRAIELKKAQILATKDKAKFDITDTEAIDNQIAGAQVREGVEFLAEGDIVYVTKDGQKVRDKSNNFVKYEDWIEPKLARFEIKTRETPDKDPITGEPIKKLELSVAAKRQIEVYEKHNIKTGVPA